MNGTSPSGFNVWFTGMMGSGKSTLAQALANRLRRLGKTIDVLDGAEVDQFLGVGRAETKDERNAETRKLAWVCRLVTRGGGIVLQAAVESPYKETRDEARRQIGRFLEVFVECPIEKLIERDKTGRYKKALAGDLKNLVGISEPYEPPQHPEVIVDTSKTGVDEAVEHILGQLVAQHLLDPAVAAMRSRPRVSTRSKGETAPSRPAARPAAKPAPAKNGASKPEAKTAASKPEAKGAKKTAPKQRAAARTARSASRKRR